MQSCPLHFLPMANRLSLAPGDKSIHVWDAETGEMVSGPFEDTRWSPVRCIFSQWQTDCLWLRGQNPFVSGMPRLARWSLAPSKDTPDGVQSVAFLPMANRLSLAPGTNPFVSGMPRLVRWVSGPFEGHTDGVPVRRIFSRWQTDCLWLPRTNPFVSGMLTLAIECIGHWKP